MCDVMVSEFCPVSFISGLYFTSFFLPLLGVFDLKYLSSSSFLTCCNLFIPSNLWFPGFGARFLCISGFSSTCRLSSAERCHQQTSQLMEISGWPPLSVCPSSSSSQQTRTSWGQNLKDVGRWLSTPLSPLYCITPCTALTPERGLDVCPRGKKEMYEHLENLSLPHWVKHSNLTVGYKC